MPQSTILVDVDRLLDDQKATKVVEKVADYPDAYLTLREAIRNGKSVTLHVRQPTVAVWFQRCAYNYGDQYIALYVYTPRAALQERWNMKIPSEVSDQDILQSGLLTLQIAVRAGQDFWDILLEHFYGSNFAYQTFPLGNLAALLNDYHQVLSAEIRLSSFIKQTLRNRLTQWRHRADSEATREIVQRLIDDPILLRNDLLAYKVLQHYPPELGIKVVTEKTWDLFKKVRMELGDLEYTREDILSALQQIEYYLTDYSERVSSTKDVEAVLQHMSGYLPEEFNYIERIVQRHPEYLTETLLQHISQRFYLLKSTLEQVFIGLRRMLRPAVPDPPDPSWSAEQWLAWIVNFYMPYYTWLDAQAKRDPVVADYAFLFADWFYKHFITLKNGEPEYFAFNALYQERERMIAHNPITLVLIIDNLNFVYFDEIRQQLNQHGFSLSEVKPLFSLIPTATHICKRALIAGQDDQADFNDVPYPAVVTRTWEPLLGKGKAKYLQNVGELQQVRSLTHSVYFLNYLLLDVALHQDNRDTGRSHAEVIHEHLVALAKAVSDFAKRFQIEHRLNLYVISDHGSTRIPQEAVNVIDQRYFKSLASEEKKHHRFLPLSDTKMEDLSQVASAQCYLIERTKFKTHENYLIARQYYRFLKTQEHFYVHGGLTPEEVVIPFARFTAAPVAPEHPTIHFINKEFRYAVKSRIQVALGNPNLYSLQALSVRLIDADAEEVFIATIAAKQVLQIAFQTTFRKVAGAANTRPLTLRVRYECQGRTFITPDQTVDITLKSLVEASDDDFDF